MLPPFFRCHWFLFKKQFTIELASDSPKNEARVADDEVMLQIGIYRRLFLLIVMQNGSIDITKVKRLKALKRKNTRIEKPLA